MVKNKHNKHPWDETMVIMVMVISGVCILLMLASYITVTGEAADMRPDPTGIFNMLNGARLFTGEATTIKPTRCNVVCAKEGLVSIFAVEDGEPVKNDHIITDKYACSCTSVMQVLGIAPDKSAEYKAHHHQEECVQSCQEKNSECNAECDVQQGNPGPCKDACKEKKKTCIKAC